MTEKQFIEKNKHDWIALSELTEKGGDPDKYHDLFIKVSGDLSYAQTYFPNRTVRWVLNKLVVQIFDQMRTKSKIDLLSSLQRFYNVTLPREIVRNKNFFLAALIVFVLSFMIGSYSTLGDEDYVRQILGNRYVSMTDENIAKGDPFAVYKGEEQSNMFLQITFNNTRVALLTFALGIFAGVGTLVVLINNGIMVGAFQTYFFTKGLLIDSLLTIWIHGTIEIISIVIAGAAGLILGGHIVKPGSYTRIQSVKIGARRALIVLVSTIPLFIVAGFFEGFVTRLTDLPVWVKLIVILGSLAFMTYVYIVNPILYAKKYPSETDEKEVYEILHSTAVSQNNNQKLSYIKNGFIRFGDHFGFLFATVVIPLTLIFGIGLYFFIDTYKDTFDMLSEDYSFHHLEAEYMPLFLLDYLSHLFTFYILIYIFTGSFSLKRNWLTLIIITFIFVLPGYFIKENEFGYELAFYFLTGLPLTGLFIYLTGESKKSEIAIDIVKFYWRDFVRIFPVLLFLLFLNFVIIISLSGVSEMAKSVVSFEYIFGNAGLGTLYFENILIHFIGIIMTILSLFIFVSGLSNIKNQYYGEDIKEKVSNFVKQNI